MNRRNLLKTGMAASLLGAAELTGKAMVEPTNHFYELRTYELRNDLQPARLNEFFRQHFVPMAKRQGIGPYGFFNVISGQVSPSVIVVIDYKSLAELQAAQDRVANDKEFVNAWQAFDAAGELPYVRYEKTLLKAFDKHPQIEIPPPTDKDAEQRPPRVFELRTYESKNAFSLRSKIEMFNQAEIKIFRDCGFAPVFFGEAVFGTRMPHLTYLIGFDNMAARDKAWDTFRANPAWARVRTKPGWTDAEVVTNIHASFLRPTAYSQIK